MLFLGKATILVGHPRRAFFQSSSHGGWRPCANASPALKKHCKTIFGDSLAQLDATLKPVKAAEERLLECQQELDTRGIAMVSENTRSTLSKVNTISQQIAQLDLNLQDTVGRNYARTLDAIRHVMLQEGPRYDWFCMGTFVSLSWR